VTTSFSPNDPESRGSSRAKPTWLEAAFRMTEETWERHANPWSVYTRYVSFPLLALSIWSREWIDLWSFVPVTTVLIWVWSNPRVFPKPASTDNWASKAVLGERVWLNRQAVPIPSGHARAAVLLSGISGIATIILAYGLWVLDPTVTILSLVLVIMAKTWFLDRMVWLYQDMNAKLPAN
jgi:hypothetical protein